MQQSIPIAFYVSSGAQPFSTATNRPGRWSFSWSRSTGILQYTEEIDTPEGPRAWSWKTEGVEALSEPLLLFGFGFGLHDRPDAIEAIGPKMVVRLSDLILQSYKTAVRNGCAR